jgi:uncharacterized phage protein (TIGR02218 family)
MTFIAAELSTFNNSPLELFLFQQGTNTWAITNAAKTQTRGSQQYTPDAVTRNESDTNPGETPKLLEVTLPISSPVTRQFVDYLPVSPVSLRVFRRHFTDPDNEYAPVFIGTVSSARFEGDVCILSCRPVAYGIERKAPWQTYQGPCNWSLYGLGCGLDKEDWKTPGVVLATDGFTLSVAAAASKPDDWFRGGFVKRVSTGDVRWITLHEGTTLTLQSRFPNLEPSEAVELFAGCNRTAQICQVKFNNYNRYLGWRFIPQKNPFEDNVFGTGTSGGGGTGVSVRGMPQQFMFRSGVR